MKFESFIMSQFLAQEDSWISWFQTGLYLRLKSVLNHRLIIITWVQLLMLPSLKHQHFLVLESCTVAQIINCVICQSGSPCFCTGVCNLVSSAANVAVLLLSQLNKPHVFSKEWPTQRAIVTSDTRRVQILTFSLAIRPTVTLASVSMAANDSMYQIPCAEPRQTRRSKGEGNVRRGPATWDSPQTTLFETNRRMQDYWASLIQDKRP